MLSSIIILITTTLYCYVHSLTASNRAKSLFRSRFGPGVDRWYRLVYNLFAGISLLPILWLLAVLPDQGLYSIPTPWILVTLLGQIAGVVIIIFGIEQSGALSFLGIRQLSSSGKERVGSEFINGGLYKWVRHPLYTGGLIIMWLAPSMTVNLLTLFLTLTVYLVVGARFEEDRLVQEFGEVYKRYQQQVPMLVPLLRRKG